MTNEKDDHTTPDNDNFSLEAFLKAGQTSGAVQGDITANLDHIGQSDLFEDAATIEGLKEVSKEMRAATRLVLGLLDKHDQETAEGLSERFNELSELGDVDMFGVATSFDHEAGLSKDLTPSIERARSLSSIAHVASFVTTVAVKRSKYDEERADSDRDLAESVDDTVTAINNLGEPQHIRDALSAALEEIQARPLQSDF